MNIKDRSKCKATPISLSSPTQQCSSSETSSERTPRRLATANQRIERAPESQLGNNLPLNGRSRSLSLSPSPKSHTLRSSSSNSNKYTYTESVQSVPLSLKSDTGSRTPTYDNRKQNVSPTKTEDSPAFFISPGNAYSNSSLLHSSGHHEQDSMTSEVRHISSKLHSDLHLTPKSAKLDLNEDHKNRSSLFHQRQAEMDATSLPLRDIFSPVPSENLEHEVPNDIPNVSVHEHGNKKSPNSMTEGGLSFPAITVENCEDKLKKSRDTRLREKTFIVTAGQIQSSSGDITGMLQVPSSLVKKRTTNGRLIVGVNDGAFFNSWSRSEGNIPVVFHRKQTTDDDPLALRIKNKEQEDLNSEGNEPESDFNVRSKTHIVLNSASHKQGLLSSKLHTDIVSRPNLRLPETTTTDIRRSIRFHSPQPQRRYEPRN